MLCVLPPQLSWVGAFWGKNMAWEEQLAPLECFPWMTEGICLPFLSEQMFKIWNVFSQCSFLGELLCLECQVSVNTSQERARCWVVIEGKEWSIIVQNCTTFNITHLTFMILYCKEETHIFKWMPAFIALVCQSRSNTSNYHHHNTIYFPFCAKKWVYFLRWRTITAYMFLALHGFPHSDMCVLSEHRRGSLYINTYIKKIIQKDKEWLGNGSKRFFSLGSQSMSEELAGAAKGSWLDRLSRCPVEVVSPHEYPQVLLKSLKSHLREPSR